MKRGLASPSVHSALAITRRSRLQLSRVDQIKSLNRRAGLPVFRLTSDRVSVLSAVTFSSHCMTPSGHRTRSKGAEVTIVDNGRLAYETAIKSNAENKPFDVILMDIQMPEMDGYMATSKLRQKNYRGIIIALTAHAMDTDRQKCIAAGCDNYASKPVDRAMLIQMLAEYFEQTRRAA